MPYFLEAAVQEMQAKLVWASARQQELTAAFVEREFQTEIGREHAAHGVARRLALLYCCLERVFALIPPELERSPERAVRLEATVFIQSFVFNAFGLLDNLAHIWVAERDVRGENGRPLPSRWIGLRSENLAVRDSLSCDARAELANFDVWFDNLTAFRDHLAHRIPLYVIPFIVSPPDAAEHARLSAELWEVIRGGDLAQVAQIKERRQRLEHFRPWMQHSINDRAPPVVFHPQMLADFVTVEKIASLILRELDRP